MSVYHDEIEIEDFEYDEETEKYYYPCPCGDRFEISKEDLESGEDVATCPSCSLMLKVIYDLKLQLQAAGTKGQNLSKSLVSGKLIHKKQEFTSDFNTEGTALVFGIVGMATDGEDGVGRSKTLPSSDHPLSSASSAGSEAPSHGKPSDFSLDQPQRLADKLLQEDSMMTEVNSRAPEIGNQTEHSGNLGPSLLEEVLHSKKMALMRDPEVMEFLRQQQEAVAQEKAFERNMRMERKEDG